MATKTPPPVPGPPASAGREPTSARVAAAGSHTTAGHLAHDANYHRSRSGRRPGSEAPPTIAGLDGAGDAPAGGESLATRLAANLSRPDLQLPETDLRPPMFLAPLEAMKDIYMRTRGRMSRKTKELLEGPDLEDLLGLLRKIFEDEKLEKHPEARLKASLHAKLKADPGPLLLGLSDPRLSEPWRLFLDRWEIWVPEGDDGGVELFWEGEADDDDHGAIELMQSLALQKGELTLTTRLGAESDRLTFDGEAYYRLRHER
jgi:hypothetical protein